MRTTSFNFNFKEESWTKTLGVQWKPKNDQLHYMVQVTKPLRSYSKRKVAYELAKICDPL